MANNFYTSKEYKLKQSFATKKNWASGIFDFLYKREKRLCAREECGGLFEVQKHELKRYCNNSCAATVNNQKRGCHPIKVRLKIANALRGRPNPYKGVKKTPAIETICANYDCKKLFLSDRWAHRKFCGPKCAMKVIGGKPTSPKAARGKSGIRKDISNSIYFYSRWEANVARLFDYLSIKWIHQPKSFNLISQTYTPDFYLSDYDLYIEVKNFMGNYSKLRDEKFRKIYPNIKLELILKDDYLYLEKNFAPLISNWEYKNSKF